MSEDLGQDGRYPAHRVMQTFLVTVPVSASSVEEASQVMLEMLDADSNSINDIGGLDIFPLPDDKPYLVCRGCGEAFDHIIPAQEHGTYIPGPDPQWCGEAGFDIVPEEDAL